MKQILPSCPRITGYEIPHFDWKNKCCWRSDLLSTEVNKEPAADFRCEGFGSAPESCRTRTPCKQTALSPRFVHSRYWHFVLGVNSKLQIIPSRLAFSVNLRLCFSVTKQRDISPSRSPFVFPAGAIVLCAFETMV